MITQLLENRSDTAQPNQQRVVPSKTLTALREAVADPREPTPQLVATLAANRSLKPRRTR